MSCWVGSISGMGVILFIRLRRGGIIIGASPISQSSRCCSTDQQGEGRGNSSNAATTTMTPEHGLI
jgi:hypothetical protein